MSDFSYTSPLLRQHPGPALTTTQCDYLQAFESWLRAHDDVSAARMTFHLDEMFQAARAGRRAEPHTRSAGPSAMASLASSLADLEPLVAELAELDPPALTDESEMLPA